MNLLLIDLASIGHAMWHVSANEPDPNAASIKTVERVRALASGQPHVAICLDTPPYFRMDIAPDYKAKRDKDNNAPIAHQMAVAADTLRADGFPIWGAKGYEADDIIATAVRHTDERFVVDSDEPWAVTIASADKDILQLVSNRVSVKSLKDGSLIGPDEVKAKFGVWPHQMVDYLSLVGDASDNIKGAEKIGPKRAAEIIGMFGDLEQCYRVLATGENTLAPSITESLCAFAPRAETVRSLITLRTDAPINFEQIFHERVPDDVAVFGGEEPMHDEREPILQGAAPAGTVPPADRAEPQPQPAAVVREAGPAHVQRDGPDAARAAAGTGQPTAVVMPREMNSAEQRFVNPMVVREPDIISAELVPWERQLEPRTYEQAKQAAADLFASRMFSAYGNAPAVLSTIWAGRELGFQAMASLRAFHVIEGKPALSAGAIHSLVLTSGKAKYFRCTERTPTRATFETQRGDDPPMALSFTIDEARYAWPKDEKAWLASGWGRNPADMLVARAITKLARLVFPDICHGLYSPEELS